MDKLTQKYTKLVQALSTLEKAVFTHNLFILERKSYNPHLDYEEEERMLRDSMIQRFEYCTDLFWKYLKKNLEEKQLAPEIKTPAEVIRKSYASGMTSEEDAEIIIDMIKDRNKTSHMYVEELAEQLTKKIPHYYELMQRITQKLTPA